MYRHSGRLSRAICRAETARGASSHPHLAATRDALAALIHYSEYQAICYQQLTRMTTLSSITDRTSELSGIHLSWTDCSAIDFKLIEVIQNFEKVNSETIC